MVDTDDEQEVIKSSTTKPENSVGKIEPVVMKKRQEHSCIEG